jgi:hypothetical protein
LSTTSWSRERSAGFSAGAATVNPSDIEIRRNHCFKPQQWRCNPTAGCPQSYDGAANGYIFIKNTAIELKNAVRVLFEGNINEWSWNAPSSTGAVQGDQKAYAILITPKNQNGQCAVCIVTDVIYRYGITRHSANGFSITAGLSDSGAASMGVARVTLHDYLMDDINPSYMGGDCCQTGIGIATWPSPSIPSSGWVPDLTVKHVTLANSGGQGGSGAIWMVQNPTTPVDMRRMNFSDNLMPAPIFMFNPASVYSGVIAAMNTLNASGDWCVQGNLITTGNWGNENSNNPWPAPSDNPPGGACHNGAANRVVGNYSAVGFVNWNGGNGGDYHLSLTSPYKGTASDGKDPGADMDTVNRYTQGVN